MNHPGVVVATDGAVEEDCRMGAVVCQLGQPSAMRVELSAFDLVLADATADEERTVLTDSLSSMQKLQSLQRSDFSEWLNGHLEKVLLESLVVRLKERAQNKVSTQFTKVPAHQGHPLNELAYYDAAASRAAVDGDEEAAVVSHADSRAVRFAFENRLTEWKAGIRRALTQVAAKQLRDRLMASNLASEAGTCQEAGSYGLIERRERRQGNRVSLAVQWMLRQAQGRAHLGSANGLPSSVPWQTSDTGPSDGS